MNLELKKQPEVISITDQQYPNIVKEDNEKNGIKNKKNYKLSSFQQFLEREGVIDSLILVVVLLFLAFVFKLCCDKKGRNSRIIRGRGTGSSVLASGTKRVLKNSSLKSNHRNGMKTPNLSNGQFSDSDGSDEDW